MQFCNAVLQYIFEMGEVLSEGVRVQKAVTVQSVYRGSLWDTTTKIQIVI